MTRRILLLLVIPAILLAIAVAIVSEDFFNKQVVEVGEEVTEENAKFFADRSVFIEAEIFSRELEILRSLKVLLVESCKWSPRVLLKKFKSVKLLETESPKYTPDPAVVKAVVLMNKLLSE